MPGPRVLLVDNYDSFTYNLAQELGVLGADVEVVGIEIDAARVAAAAPYARVGVTFRRGGFELPVDGRAGLGRYEGRKIALGIRPEDLEDAALTATPAPRLAVAVDLREDMGSEIFLHFSIDAPPVATEDVKEAVEADEAVAALEEQAVRAGTPFVARVGRESRAREGDRLELAVDTRMLHFFDLDSGAAISR